MMYDRGVQQVVGKLKFCGPRKGPDFERVGEGGAQ